MFFGCFAWNGVNFMYKSQVRQGAVYVGAMALRCEQARVMMCESSRVSADMLMRHAMHVLRCSVLSCSLLLA